MGVFDFLFGAGRRKPAVHELKWKLPEARLSLPVADANDAVGKLRKMGAKFLGGGRFHEVIHAKRFGEGVYGYFIVRTDPRTEKETLAFEGYMLDEDDKLNLDVESGFQIMSNLKSMGYEEAFERDATVWALRWRSLPVTVFQIKDAGSFVEASLPGVKFENVRNAQQKTAMDLFKKLGAREDDVLPTDVITLQYSAMQEQGAPGGGPDSQASGRPAAKPSKPFTLGSSSKKENAGKETGVELSEMRLEDSMPRDEKASGAGKNAGRTDGKRGKSLF